MPSDAQIRLLIVTLVGFGFAIYLGVQAGQERFKMISGLGLAVGVVVLMTMLKQRFWLLLPFGMSLEVPVPVTFGRDFSAKELTVMCLVAFTVVQVALRRQRVPVFRKEHLWPLLYSAWAVMVFVLNPSGLLIFGSGLVGARYYFIMGLAIASFLVVASVSIEEEDVKWVFGSMLLATIINTLNAWRLSRSNVASIVEDFAAFGAFGPEQFYTWHQAIGIPAVFILTVLFSHYRMTELGSFKQLKWWPVILGAVVLSFWSGKRMGAVTVCALPVFSAFVRREFARGGLIATAILAGALVLAVGQGHAFNLPLNMQRALSVLPGDWHPSADLGSTDEYRRQLREDAIEQIKRSPWIGPGFAFDPNDIWADTLTTKGRKIITGTRAGGSWHTTWLGISADFGIPAALIWALLMVRFTRLSYRTCHALPEGTWRKTLSAYIFIHLCTSWMTSYTGGHTALGAFHNWWIWGMILPLARQAELAEAAAAPGILPGAVQPQQETHAFTR